MVDVPPRSVLGYERVMPPVPAHQPALLPGTTAGRSARVLAVRTAVGVVVALLALQVLPVLLVSPASIGGGYLVLRAWGRVGDRCLEELRAGYTTLTIDVGDFWYGGDTRWIHHGARWATAARGCSTPAARCAPRPATCPSTAPASTRRCHAPDSSRCGRARSGRGTSAVARPGRCEARSATCFHGGAGGQVAGPHVRGRAPE